MPTVSTRNIHHPCSTVKVGDWGLARTTNPGAPRPHTAEVRLRRCMVHAALLPVL